MKKKLTIGKVNFFDFKHFNKGGDVCESEMYAY